MTQKERIYELVRFLFVGAATTIFSYAIYIALLAMLPYMLAYIMSYAAGVVFSYFMNSYFVFNANFSWRSFLRFPLVYAAQLIINIATVWLAVEQLQIQKEFAPLLAIVISIPITYLMSRAILKNGKPAN